MNKKLLTLFVVSAVLISGCGKSRKYDSEFADACEFASYWCGPCEEVGYTHRIAHMTSHIIIFRLF